VRHFEYLQTPKEPIVWPSRPDLPRYQYIGELVGEKNYLTDKREQSFWSSLLGLFVGQSRPRILLRPHNGFTATDGTVYVADTSRQAIFVFDNAANRLSLWEYAEPNIKFVSPVAVTAAPDNTIIISDAELGYLSRFDAQGKHLGTIGKGTISRPTGVAVEPHTGRIYVSDTTDHSIKVFGAKGELLQVIGERGEKPGTFNYPTYLHIAADKLFVTDAMNARVQILTLDGTPLQTIGTRGQYVGNTPRPKGVTTDSDGNIYVVESYFDHLLIFNPEGKFLLPIGGTGSDIGSFYLPAGVWSDSNNRIYIADMFNGRVVVMQYLGGE
jgi:DNA-binding beta-propeller fold protein YncE